MIKKPTISEKDNSYWDNYYSHNNVPKNPSSFAKNIVEKIDKTKLLVELGCGNGRDSFFFARNNIQTLAIDLSSEAINLNSSFNHANVGFLYADFTKLENNSIDNIGTIYSRFSLHSIGKASYLRCIEWCSKNICKGGSFFLEARTINDPLYGKGNALEDDVYITTHYRRFFKIKEVISDLENIGFDITSAIEDYTGSWYKDDHAVVFRIECKK